MKKQWQHLDQRDRTRYIMRTMLVVLMVSLILYIGVMEIGLIAFDVGYRRRLVPLMLALLVSMIIWTLYLRNNTKKPSPMLHIVEYTTLALYTIFISGFTPSIYLFWLATLVLSAVFFRKKGLVLGSLAMYATTFLAYYVNYLGEYSILGSGTTAASVTVIVAITFALVAEYTGVSRYLYEQAHQDSLLQQERLGATVNSINEAILATDANGYIKVYNAAALSILDTNIDLEAKKIERFVKIVKGRRSFDVLKYAKEQKRFFTRDDLQLVYPGGDKIDLYVSCSPIGGEYKSFRTGRKEGGGFVLLLRDITKQKSLDEERDDFVSVVSHELRTPAAVAEGTLSNIEFLLEKKSDPTVMLEQVKTAYEQIRYLEKMINDISTLSRAERGVGAEAEIINVQELAQTLVGQYAPEAEKKGLKLKLVLDKDLGSVRTSRLYLEEILQNLVTNSIKYTKKGSVTLSVKNKGNHLVFAVSDTGIGISHSDQQRIFEKFFRSEDFRTRESSGTGLGLYITAKLSKLIDVQVQVDSELNKGSTFSFEIPKDR